MIKHTTHVLANGMKVVLAPDSAIPVVTLAMAVPVGARQEQRGRSGFAHLFEHLMFEGSAHVPKGRFDKILESYGAENNAWTSNDYTFYYETLPSHALPVGLWLDADRLSALQITQEALSNQVDVVKEEKKQNVYNEAYGRLLWMDVASNVFSNWQNSHDTYGDFKDLEAANLADVQKFFNDHYAPENIQLALVGDFDPQKTLKDVETYFGWIPNRGESRLVDTAEPAQEKERVFKIEDSLASVSGVAIVWNNMPERRSRAYYAMTLLGRILFEGKSARLYQKLVKDAQVATAVDDPYTGGLGFPVSDWESFRTPGLFGGFILRRENVSASSVRDLIFDETGEVARAGVGEAELERVKTKFRSDWIVSRQTTVGRAAALLVSSVLDGDPGCANGELEKFMAVTREDIQKAAGAYLVPAAANIFDLLPKAALKEATP